MSRALPQVAVIGVVLFFILGISLQLLNFVFSAWFVQVFVFFGIPWIFYRLARQEPSSALGLSAVSPNNIAAGAFLGVVCWFAVILPLMHVTGQLFPDSWKEMFDGRAVFFSLEGMERALMVVVVVLVAPLGEEVFFRGFIQPRLIRRWGVPLGLLSTSVLFSLIHVDPVGFLARVALGILFGWLAYASASLWVSIAAHACYNLLVCVLFFSFGSEDVSLGQGVLFLWLVLGAGGMLALLWFLGFSPPVASQALNVHSQEAPLPPVSLWQVFRPWLLAAGGSCLLLLAVDHRGVALNMFDTVAVPLPRAARNSLQLQAEMERMQKLRQQARKGQTELKKYFECRREFYKQLPADIHVSSR